MRPSSSIVNNRSSLSSATTRNEGISPSRQRNVKSAPPVGRGENIKYSIDENFTTSATHTYRNARRVRKQLGVRPMDFLSSTSQQDVCSIGVNGTRYYKNGSAGRRGEETSSYHGKAIAPCPGASQRRLSPSKHVRASQANSLYSYLVFRKETGVAATTVSHKRHEGLLALPGFTSQP